MIVSDWRKAAEADGAGNAHTCAFYIQNYAVCPEMVFPDVDAEAAASFTEGVVRKAYIPGVVVGDQLD